MGGSVNGLEFSVGLWVGAVLGGAFVYVALWRKRRDTADNAALVRKWTDAPLVTHAPVLPSDSGFLREARYTPPMPEPVHRRLTDAVAHPRPKVYGRAVVAHVMAAEVIEPVRTESGFYRPRHATTAEPTVAINPAEVLPRRHDDTFWQIVRPTSMTAVVS